MKKGGAGRGQGRKKGSQNVKGNFDASLPPVRCKQALYDTIEALANAEGKSMSTWMREQLETITSNAAFQAQEKAAKISMAESHERGAAFSCA